MYTLAATFPLSTPFLSMNCRRFCTSRAAVNSPVKNGQWVSTPPNLDFHLGGLGDLTSRILVRMVHIMVYLQLGQRYDRQGAWKQRPYRLHSYLSPCCDRKFLTLYRSGPFMDAMDAMSTGGQFMDNAKCEQEKVERGANLPDWRGRVGSRAIACNPGFSLSHFSFHPWALTGLL